MMTFFTARNPYIFTVTSVPEKTVEGHPIQDIEFTHQRMGGEHRRNDFMFPQVYAVIDGIDVFVLQ